MNILRCTAQGPETLEEHYVKLGQNPRWSHECDSMIGLIERLRENIDERRAFGLTSHYMLSLLAEDSHLAPAMIHIRAKHRCGYEIEYMIPKRIELIGTDTAYAFGEAGTVWEAIDMVKEGMDKSEGWGRAADKPG